MGCARAQQQDPANRCQTNRRAVQYVERVLVESMGVVPHERVQPVFTQTLNHASKRLLAGEGGSVLLVRNAWRQAVQVPHCVPRPANQEREGAGSTPSTRSSGSPSRTPQRTSSIAVRPESELSRPRGGARRQVQPNVVVAFAQPSIDFVQEPSLADSLLALNRYDP